MDDSFELKKSSDLNREAVINSESAIGRYHLLAKGSFRKNMFFQLKVMQVELIKDPDSEKICTECF